jgi:hypothetical protein
MTPFGAALCSSSSLISVDLVIPDVIEVLQVVEISRPIAFL